MARSKRVWQVSPGIADFLFLAAAGCLGALTVPPYRTETGSKVLEEIRPKGSCQTKPCNGKSDSLAGGSVQCISLRFI
jgi:hypothetical protein